MAIVGGLGSPEVPDWAPLRENVATYVPHRTLARVESSIVASEDTYYLTFDQETRPNGTSVDLLIADGVAWVESRVTPLNAASQGAARVVATLYAAAAVERGWPDDDQSLQRANDMEKRMDVLLGDLIVSNEAANAGDGAADTIDVVFPVWSFPEADSRYDSAAYF